MSAARVVVADLGSGNLRSVEKALAAVGASAIVTADADEVARAEKLVVPGQGAFGACAAGLDRGGGALRQAVAEAVASGRPFFGICIGMQLPSLKIPHMGWNQTRRGPAAAHAGIADDAFFYFVHSYYAEPTRAEDVALTSEHGVPFCAAVARDNVFACQFHPEKSQSAGLSLLRRFVSA